MAPGSHNLKKHSTWRSPDKLVVFTGLSGSGKSTLPLTPTIYAERSKAVC
jgi:excinuclease UvrABC ATPase subunit